MISELLETHGYWILIIGCLLEGETVLLLAGFAAYRGYLDPQGVIAIAAVATFATDQFYFWLGRWQGPRVFTRWPSVAARADRVHRLLDRWHAFAIIGLRFAYGLRIAGPVLFGTSSFPALRFAAFNAVGALLWASVIGTAGWLFGEAAEAMLGDAKRFQIGVILVLVVAGSVLAWTRRRR